MRISDSSEETKKKQENLEHPPISDHFLEYYPFISSPPAIQLLDYYSFFLKFLSFVPFDIFRCAAVQTQTLKPVREVRAFVSCG